MSRMKNKMQELQSVNIKKLWFMGILATVVMVSLTVRLFYIQIVKHDLYTTEVNKQRRMHIPLNSGRGLILDRNLIPMTDRVEKTIVIVFPQLFTINDDTIGYLYWLTGIRTEDLINRIRSTNSIIELPLLEIAKESVLQQVRGLFIVNKKQRYDELPKLSHIIGYINQSDKRGLYGLEKSLDSLLQGKETRTLAAVVDGRKRLLPGEGYTLVNQGANQTHVKLTIDYHLQSLVEGIMDSHGKDGAVVVSRIDTGELLAIASRPNFKANSISEHLNSNGDELYNKALQLTFPPGSIFKIVVAAAALEEGLVDFDEEFFCNGIEQIGNVQIKCNSFNQGGHGSITFLEAFAESCNSTFIQLGQRIGAERIVDMAKRLGLSEKLGIGILEEESGNLPKGDELLGPAIGNISIGQGVIEVTPLQINQLTQIIANGGMKKSLFLVDSVLDDNYKLIEKLDITEGERLLQPEIVEKLQLLMEQVMKEGTGKDVGEFSSETGGKTGTAQATAKGQSVLHAWFTGYYPAEKPQYAITVFIQNGGSGGKVAVPIFRELLEKMKEMNF